jgi:hypothetical protein
MSFPESPSRIDTRLYVNRFPGIPRIAAIAASPKNKYPASHKNKQNRIENIHGFSFLEGRKTVAEVHVDGKLMNIANFLLSIV